MTIIKHELKMNMKSFLIWFFSVSLICVGCIFLFPVVKDSMATVAESYANMSGFSEAFGLDKLSIATMEGFFATEIGTMYSLGAAMFAALLGIGILSKEEGAHTCEFLMTLPFGRTRVITEKLVSIGIFITLFDAIHYILFLISILSVGEKVDQEVLLIYMLLQYFMHLEIAAICFFLSALSKKNQVGMGLGITLIFYMLDIISRITKEMKPLKYFTPFYYSNASDIFGNSGDIEIVLVVIGGILLLVSIAGAYLIYKRRDLSI